MSTLKEDMVNCLLLSNPEGEGHWSQAWGTTHPPPCFMQDQSPSSSLTALCPSEGPETKLLFTAGPQPPRTLLAPVPGWEAHSRDFLASRQQRANTSLGFHLYVIPEGRRGPAPGASGPRRARMGEGALKGIFQADDLPLRF